MFGWEWDATSCCLEKTCPAGLCIANFLYLGNTSWEKNVFFQALSNHFPLIWQPAMISIIMVLAVCPLMLCGPANLTAQTPSRTGLHPLDTTTIQDPGENVHDEWRFFRRVCGLWNPQCGYDSWFRWRVESPPTRVQWKEVYHYCNKGTTKDTGWNNESSLQSHEAPLQLTPSAWISREVLNHN